MAKRELPNDGLKIKSYPSNSNSEKKKLNKVVDGEAIVVKKPLKKKFSEVFFNGDLNDIRGFLFFDVLVPSIKDMISEMVRQGVDLLLYSGEGMSTSHKRRKGNFNYEGCYNKPQRNTRLKERSRYHNRSDELVDLSFNDLGTAERILSDMVDLIADYDSKSVSVADYYDLAGYTSYNFQDNKYGWRDLTGVRAYRIKLPREEWKNNSIPEYGWVLDLPRPEYIGE